jgi:hypothetical protein
MRAARRSLVLVAAGLFACGKKGHRLDTPVPLPSRSASSASARAMDSSVVVPAPREGLVYRSGSRLKIQWAEPIGPPSSVRIASGIVDAKTGRVCKMSYGGGERTCLPEDEQQAPPDDIGYLDEKQHHPVLVVDDSLCSAPPSPEPSLLWALPLHMESTPNRYVLEGPRRVQGVQVAAGSGCVVRYEKSTGAVCVRPFRLADVSDVVSIKESVLGREGEPSGVVVAAGADGSVLPLQEGAEYLDSKNEFRCALDDTKCVPRRYDILMDEAVVGTKVKTVSSSGGLRWAVTNDWESWARLSSERVPRNDAAFGARLIESILDEAHTIHFAESFDGEGRIALHVRAMPDGRRVPVSLYDRHLGSDCVPTRTDDGRWRCTVAIPASCELAEVGERDGGTKTEALSPSSSFCHKPETCCKGGTFYFPGLPARGARRFGDDGPRPPMPAVRGRVIRFAELSRMSDQVRMWAAGHRVLVYDKLEEHDETAFAELRLARDP